MPQGTRVIVCCKCQEPFEFLRRPGSPPKYCDGCRPSREHEPHVRIPIPNDFVETFPVMLNSHLAKRYGVHWRTVIRWARDLDLQKSPEHVSAAISEVRRKPVERAGFKRCMDCQELKPVTEYHKANGGRTLQPRCKPCHKVKVDRWRSGNEVARKIITRRAFLKKTYGLSIEEWDLILERQGGGCAICGGLDDGSSLRRRLHVDHDHVTGKVRGLLCTDCNNGLGRFEDDQARLRRAAEYLAAAGRLNPEVTDERSAEDAERSHAPRQLVRSLR